MKTPKTKITSWRFNTAALAVLLIAFFGYTVLSRYDATSGAVVPYYPADCMVTPPTERLTSADTKAFIAAYQNNEQASLVLTFSCGGGSSASGEYTISNRLLASNGSIRDKLVYSASASPESTDYTTCNVSYSDAEDDRMGDRFALLDCARSTFKLSYGGQFNSAAAR